MAQHPEKIKWRASHSYGLSASQFGMALGFCGRVSDYVHYLRDIVGTEQEFKGNAVTDHGINTEPKSRALYELLLGCRVHDGGFFVTHDRILGCSPDGQIYLDSGEQQTRHTGALSSWNQECSRKSYSDDFVVCGEGDVTQHPHGRGRCSVRVPFKSKRRARSPQDTLSGRPSHSSETLACDSNGRTSATAGDTRCSTEGGRGTRLPKSPVSAEQVSPPPRREVRLLEIKSPFRALYDSNKGDYQCYGIPKHYICQIQGQLAIADCEECDFFVYLDRPMCQVEGWRVRRSRAFWAWAEPNLRCVSSWVKDGPPDWLNRSFAFAEFDFRSIEVAPLVFPFDITANAALTDARRFSFFAQFPNPIETLHRYRADHNNDHSPMQAQDGSLICEGSAWATLTECERVAIVAQSPVVRLLFACVGNEVDDTHTCETEIQLWCRFSSWRQVLEKKGLFEESATGMFWQAWTSTAKTLSDPFVRVSLNVPYDWSGGQVVARCCFPSPLPTEDKAMGSVRDVVPLGFYEQLFFASLLSDDAAAVCEREMSFACAVTPHVSACVSLPNFNPVLSGPASSSPKRVQLAHTGASGVPHYDEVASSRSSSLMTATPFRRDGSSYTVRSSSVVCVSPRNPSPSEPHDVQSVLLDCYDAHSAHQQPFLKRGWDLENNARRSPKKYGPAADELSAASQQAVGLQSWCLSGNELAATPVVLDNVTAAASPRCIGASTPECRSICP